MYMSKKSEKLLSLGNWPEVACAQEKINLSILSRKILQDSGITFEQIFPCTFQQYVENKKIHSSGSQKLSDMYQRYQERRRKKVSLLKKLRLQFVQSESKELKPVQIKSSVWMKSTKSTKKTNPSSKEKEKESSTGSKHKIKKIKQKTKTISSHNDYYCQYRRSSSSKSKSKNKSKKLSKIDKTKPELKYTPIEEYYDSTGTKTKFSSFKNLQIKRSFKNLSISPFQILEEMKKYMKQSNDLDTKLQMQVKSNEQLPSKEKKRLKKIHIIEKLEQKQKMEDIRAKLSSVMETFKEIKMTKSRRVG